jgi:4-amino-4-deoxy-L-arabinose transferase-like glycosyltransferase
MKTLVSESRQFLLMVSSRWLQRVEAYFWLALFLRLCLFYACKDGIPEIVSYPDTQGYIGPARALVSDGALYTEPGSSIPAVARAPGFSCLVAVVFWLFKENYTTLVLLLCLLSSSIVIPVYKLSDLLYGKRTAGLAAFFFAVNITAISNSPLLLTDSFFAFFVAWQLYFFCLFFKTSRLKYLYYSIVIIACATLVRPISFLWFCPAAFLVFFYPKLTLKQKCFHTLASVFVFWVVIGPWMFRNYSVGAGFRIDINIGALYHQNGGMLLATVNGTSYIDEKLRTIQQSEVLFKDTIVYPTVSSKVDYKIKQFSALVKTYPIEYARLHLQPQILLPDVTSFCNLIGITRPNLGTLDLMQRQGVMSAVKVYFQGQSWVLFLLLPFLFITALCYTGFVTQLIICVKNGDWFYLLMVAAFVFYYLILPGPITMPRYHLPALPLLVTFGAEGTLMLFRYLAPSRVVMWLQ